MKKYLIQKNKCKISSSMRELIKINSFKKLILENLNKKFPHYYNFIENVEDSGKYCFGIAIYNVPKKMVEKVENYVLKLDWELCRKNNFCLVPLVRNKEITKQYYPNLLKSNGEN